MLSNRMNPIFITGQLWKITSGMTIVGINARFNVSNPSVGWKAEVGRLAEARVAGEWACAITRAPPSERFVSTHHIWSHIALLFWHLEKIKFYESYMDNPFISLKKQ